MNPLTFLSLSLLLFLSSCHGIQIQQKSPQNFPLFDSQNSAVNMTCTIINGQSIHQKFQSICQQNSVNKENCDSIMDAVSHEYYSVYYTPSRPTSTIEDFYANRTDLLLYITQRFSYQSYLEIGCFEDINYNILKHLHETSVGVDPQMGGTLRMTSDEFFQQNQQKFDLIFIDGDHNAEQVWKDITNSLMVLNEGGTVVIHDLNPRVEDRQLPVDQAILPSVWLGDGWRAAVAMRLVSDYEIVIVDIDLGCGVIRKRPNTHPLPAQWHHQLLQMGTLPNQTLPGSHSLPYQEFDRHRDVFYRLMTLLQLREWLET
jgi:hypothetical protein